MKNVYHTNIFDFTAVTCIPFLQRSGHIQDNWLVEIPYQQVDESALYENNVFFLIEYLNIFGCLTSCAKNKQIVCMFAQVLLSQEVKI